ncbi:MAG: C10 family peptidase [Bacteroidales bacterium]|nr:C10 family peptidase [Bacteroidales bacterium]
MKQNYLSSRLSAALLVAMVSMGWNAAEARHLSPEEALQLARTAAPAKAPGQSQQYQLAYDGSDVYVFSRESSDGFLVLGADDQLENIVLGYSDTQKFDAANIPASMQWLLNVYGYKVQAIEQGALMLKAPARISREAIDPICKTFWNQTSPYNDDCPIQNGERCVTGCVATAMAQVMKVHEWPVTGTGFISYQYPNPVNTYTETYDFASTTFDWANMLNEYTSSASAEQKAAVATLMHACGAATKMIYSPSESSASDVYAGIGLISYLGYGKSLEYLERNWIETQDEWETIIYDQLQQGLPVLYGGLNENGEGHEFVCDGYDGSNYFHINWGWGGYGNGYFDLTILNPEIKGTGGGNGSEGFCYSQDILVNVVPAPNSTKNTYAMAINSDLSTENSSYNRKSSTNVKATTPLYSYTLFDANLTLGFLLTNGSEEHFVSSVSNTLTTLEGYPTWLMKTTDFPVGTWDAYPAFKDPDGVVHRAYYDLNSVIGHLKTTVTSDKITFEQPGRTGTLDAKLASVTPIVEEDNDVIYSGHSYDFTWDVTYSGEWVGKVLCGIVYNGYIYSTCDTQVFDFDGSGTTQKTFRVAIDSSIPTGSYTMSLFLQSSSSSYSYIGTQATINIVKREASGSADVTAVNFSDYTGRGTKSDPVILTTDSYIQLTLKCTSAPYADEVCLAFADPSSMIITNYSNPIWATIDTKGDTVDVQFNKLGQYLVLDEMYAMVAWSNTSGQLGYNLYYIELIEANSLNSAVADGRKAKIEGGNMVLSGFDEGEVVAIYRANGTLVYRGTARNIPVSPAQLYIVTYPGGSFKLATR